MTGSVFSPTAWADGWWNLVSIGFCQGLVSVLLIGLFLWSFGHLASARLRYWLLVLLLVKLALPPLPGWGLFPWMSRVSLVKQTNVNVVAVPAKAPALQQTDRRQADAFSAPLPIKQPRPVLPNGPRRHWRFPLKLIGMSIHLLGGVLLLATLIGQQWWLLHQIHQSGQRHHQGPWFEDLQRLKQRIGVTDSVELWSTSSIDTPAVVGVARKKILLPVWTLDAGREQREAILGHELAHVRRHDTLAVWIESMLIALQWWNPVAFYVNRLIRREREWLCDGLALQTTVCNPRVYADTLINALAHASLSRRLRLVTKMIGNSKWLSQRLEGIMSDSVGRETHLGIHRLMGLALVAVMLLPGLPITRRAQTLAEPTEIAVGLSHAGNVEVATTPANSARTDVDGDSLPSKSQAVQTQVETADKRDDASDAAITALRREGGRIREFKKRGDAHYWVQIILEGASFDDDSMLRVEAICRCVKLDLHLRETSVTQRGLSRLEAAGEISDLALSGTNIDDAMLGVLPSLPINDELQLDSNIITDRGIGEIAGCRKLKRISLHGKHLTDSCLQHLVKLPALEGVSLSADFSPNAFEFLGRMEGLQGLSLGSGPGRIGDADIKKFSGLPRLRRLTLSGTMFGNELLKAISSSNSLEQLYLHETSVTSEGVRDLTGIASLEVLSITRTEIGDEISESIRQMKNLRWLSLDQCPIGDDTLAAIGSLKKLRMLMLTGSSISDAGVAHLVDLEQLRYLSLQANPQITDAAIPSLRQLTSLTGTGLQLNFTGLTIIGVRQLQRALPQVNISY